MPFSLIYKIYNRATTAYLINQQLGIVNILTI